MCVASGPGKDMFESTKVVSECKKVAIKAAMVENFQSCRVKLLTATEPCKPGCGL